VERTMSKDLISLSIQNEKSGIEIVCEFEINKKKVD
jgi:hypothetical protein